MNQSEIHLAGHAIECRINAEDPAHGFRPAPGRIERWESPTGPNLRVDTHVGDGYEVPPFYDSLLCKVIAHGDSRADAIETMLGGLGHLVCEPIPTTATMHQAILRSPAFQSNAYDNRTLPGWPPQEEG
jgi:acetyl-CoA carboxylase biotin carboxylase subunit